MQNHHFVALLALLLLPLAGPATARAQDGPDSLWAKAVSLYEANADRVPGSLYMHMQEVDKHGEPKDDKGQEIWTRLYLNEDGEVDAELVKMLVRYLEKD